MAYGRRSKARSQYKRKRRLSRYRKRRRTGRYRGKFYKKKKTAKSLVSRIKYLEENLISRRRVYDYIEQLYTSVAGRQGLHILPVMCDRVHYRLCWEQNHEDGSAMGGGPDPNVGNNRIALAGYRCTQYKSCAEYTISNDSNFTQKVVLYWCKLKRNVMYEEDTATNNPVWDKSQSPEDNIRAYLVYQANKETSTGEVLELPGAGPFHGDAKKMVHCYKTKTIIMKNNTNYAFRSIDYGRKSIDYDYHVADDRSDVSTASADLFRYRTHFVIARVIGATGASTGATTAAGVSTAPTQMSCICKRTIVFGFTSPHKNYSEIRGTGPPTGVDITMFVDDLEEQKQDA